MPLASLSYQDEILIDFHIYADLIGFSMRVSMCSFCDGLVIMYMWCGLQEVVAEGMKALYGLFMQRPSASSLPADVNAQIINVSHRKWSFVCAMHRAKHECKWILKD